MAAFLWPFSTGLPWQLELLQDSMVSADKEEEVAVLMKARWTFHTLTPTSFLLLTLIQFSQSVILLTEESTTFILGHMLFFSAITLVLCRITMAYTPCLCLKQLSVRFGMQA